MHHYVKSTTLAILCLSTGTSAFVAPSRTASRSATTFGMARPAASSAPQYTTRLYTAKEDESQDDEIERLKTMAAKLRAEATALEAERAEDMAKAAEKAFRKFDKDEDGEVSVVELKAGLEKILKTDLSDARVKTLMEEFDASGDGKLQLDEFVGLDTFRNRLEALAREEKRIAVEAAKEAKKEEEEAAALQARIELLNDNPPTTTDKLVSVLPYLFPLLDGLQFGRFLLTGQDNPFIALLAIVYTLYRSVPFGGFIVFFLLNFLGSNPSINRLVRFNMQQAIFLDIALFFPGLLAALSSLVLSGMGSQIPPSVTEIGSDAMFVTLLATVAYCVVSSALGITPDKVPFISKAVSDRMPTIDWFDDQGRYIPREFRETKKDDEETKDKKD